MKRKIIKSLFLTVLIVLLMQIGCFADEIELPIQNIQVNTVNNVNTVTNRGNGDIMNIISLSVSIIIIIAIALAFLNFLNRHHTDISVNEDSDDEGE